MTATNALLLFAGVCFSAGGFILLLYGTAGSWFLGGIVLLVAAACYVLIDPWW